VANVILDGPSQPAPKENTANNTYVRFHWQDADIWYGSGIEEEDRRLNRYKIFMIKNKMGFYKLINKEMT
jgi:hypothetical protein